METPNDIAQSIRELPEIEIEDCAVMVRAIASRLGKRQRGYQMVGSRVVCPVAMALEQLDFCADLVSESAYMVEQA